MSTVISVCLIALLSSTTQGADSTPAPAKPAAMQESRIELGKIEFQVETNIKAFRFTGQAKSLRGSVAAEGDEPRSLRFEVPVDSLSTGMALRDRHMRERIFQKADGSAPDITFVSDSIECLGGFTGNTIQNCQVEGRLSLRGESRAFAFPVRIQRDGKTATADGETEIRLTDFGIDAPKHLGVKVDERIKLKFEVISPAS